MSLVLIPVLINVPVLLGVIVVVVLLSAVVIVFFLTLGYMTKICLDFFNNSVLPLIAG